MQGVCKNQDNQLTNYLIISLGALSEKSTMLLFFIMEKEQILSNLQTRLGETSLSERTMMAYIENHLPEGESEPTEEYFAKAEKFFKSLNGQFSHDVAGKVNEFKKNYKPSTDTKEGEDSTITKLMAEVEKLRNEMNQGRLKTDAEKMRSEILSKKEELKIRNTAIWEDAVAAVDIQSDSKFDDTFAKAKEIYEGKMRRYFGEGARPYSVAEDSSGKKAQEENAKLRKGFLDKLRQEGKLPAN